MVVALISPYWDAVATSAGLLAIVAVGLYISSSAGALSVAHAAIAGMGGYAGAILTTNFGAPFGVAIAAGILLGIATGVLLAAATLRMNPLVAGLTTLAFGETMVVVALNIDYLGAGSSFYGIPPHTTLGVVYSTLAIVLFIGWRFERSRLGLAARACRDDSDSAAATGVPVTRVKLTVFALGAGIAAAGGVLRVHYVLVERPADLGFANSLEILIVWVFGGSYIFLGPAIGAMILTFLPELLRFSQEERLIVYGLLLTIMVLIRPQGLLTRQSWQSVAMVGRRAWRGRAKQTAEKETGHG
jgi:branched-chain amino acid transport system permease protein